MHLETSEGELINGSYQPVLIKERVLKSYDDDNEQESFTWYVRNFTNIDLILQLEFSEPGKIS
jgi:hypothetical protein